MQTKSRHAFTLIELLVVIAIIAILAAILFPVFARAREQARKTSCLSNEKQIGTALYMYAQDYDEALPQRYGGGSVGDYENLKGTLYQRTWKSMLYPYIKNYDVYKCPSNDAAKMGQWAVDAANDPNIHNPVYAAGYEMWLPAGGFLTTGIFVNGASDPQTLAGLSYPAQELIIIETHYGYPDIGPYLNYCEPSPCPGDTGAFPGASTWGSGHAKKAGNIIYLDGHAKYRHYRDTFTDDPGRNNENDWRYSYNYAKNNNYGWVNTAPDRMDSYPNDSGSN